MNIAAVLASICAFCAVLGVYRAIKNRNEELEPTKNGETIATTTDRSPHTVKHHLQWISSAELSQMMSIKSGLVIFQLLTADSLKEMPRRLPGVAAVTLQQLQESLPWTPVGMKVVIYRTGGIDPALARKLSVITSCRETFLLLDSEPPTQKKSNQIVGATCQ
jgi:hypothetical protein